MTYMRAEINEIPEATERLLERSTVALATCGRELRERDPAFLVTIARGSSDHAATFIKYAAELSVGRAVASLGPSLASIYGTTIKLDSAAAIAISQSGKSPDIVSMVKAATKSGATTIAITNTILSPITAASRYAIDIQAGPELAVAATKSFVNSIVAALFLLSEWSGDAALKSALRLLPVHFEKAIHLDWGEFAAGLSSADSLYTLGRGPTLAIASEAALKFKETSNMHAEAYSTAELLHGPIALVDEGFPALTFAARDAAEPSVAEITDAIAAKGAFAFATSDLVKSARRLPFIATGHPLTDALTLILPFYSFVEAWSCSKGLNPDKPAALKKVTETL